MQFAPDTVDTLAFIVALTNTTPTASRSGDDELTAIDELTALLAEHSYTGRFDRDEKERLEVIETRELLRGFWQLSRDDAVPALNRMLAEAQAVPELVRHDEWDWHLHATEPSAPLAERIRVECALALIDLIRSNEWERLHSCAADGCDGLYFDLSRNGSKRFCSTRCGNRVNMADYRARSV